MKYENQLKEWFEVYGDVDYKPELNFEDLANKLHPAIQVSAIMFLASKLKDKSETYFLHGEHDTLYIGDSFSKFEEFSEEDVKIAVAHGIYINDYDNGFQLYASM